MQGQLTTFNSQMICLIKRFIKPLICIVPVLHGIGAAAQAPLLQNAIDKLESFKNFSYQSVYRQKEYTSDTLEIQHKEVFLKAPADKSCGYLFSMEMLTTGNKFPSADLYNGQFVAHINPADSTFTTDTTQRVVFQRSMLSYLKMLKGLAQKKPFEVAGDTTINGVNCSHVLLKTYDTIINKEHFYTRIHIFIDKATGLPNSIMARSRSIRNGDGITNYYSESRYFDYKLNQDNINAASMRVPDGFHPPQKQHVKPALLTPDAAAPDWTLFSAEGKKTSLAEMKGKVVLLDFFFIGCEGCMLSLKPLNKLHEQYKDQNVAMVSMTFRDSRKSVMEFKKTYNISYPIYVEAGDVVKSYHVDAFPTFYFIDKEGKIAGVFVGYNDNFEEKVTSVIDSLLKR